ncbi:MAG: O-antigen ligase family protein [Anaerolineae bacterium]|nr:O-antigen ligase family protein [Anaerolineae bacterium]
MRRNPLLLLGLGALLLLAPALGIPQLVARQHFMAAGQPDDFPPKVDDTGTSPLCANAALEQYDAASLTWALDTIAAGEFTWVRQRFPWAEIEPAPGEYQWERWDRIVAGAVKRGMQLIPVLDSPPEWAGMPPEPEAFAQFAGTFANHYLAQLVYYQLWHNPNLGTAWDGEANPYVYAELLAHAAPAIRAADPDARIILGGLAPNVETGPQNYAEDRFLELLYTAGAAPYFDVVAVQPYGFDAGPEERQVARETFNFSRPLLVREVMKRHADAEKAIWITDFGWNSLPAAWEDVPSIWGSVDEATQAAYTVAALKRAETEWPWMGVLCLNGFQPRPATQERPVPDAEEHWGFALVGPEGEPRPVYTAVQTWAARPQVARPGVYPAQTALAEFTGTWRLGPLGADIGASGDRVALTFEGTAIALTVRRGPYRAFLFVTVDGKPAPALPRDEQGRAYIVLYDPLAAVATVPLAEQLPPGQHTVTVVADRGWYQWSLVDWRIMQRPDPTPYRVGYATLGALGLLGLVLSVVSARQIAWRAAYARLLAYYNRLGEPGQIILTTVAGALFGLAAWLTWAQGAFRRLGDTPTLLALLASAGLFYFSPWLLLTLSSGALFFLLVILRPELGLALTIATAPFYLHPLSLFGKSFSMAELVLLPTLAGSVIRLLGEQATQRAERAIDRRFSWPVIAFVLLATLSTLLAAHRHEAFRELRLVIIEPALFGWALLAYPLTKRDRWRVIDFYLLGAVIIALIGLTQYFLLGDVIRAEGGIRRLRSIYGSPNNVGLYLGRVIPLLLAVTFFGRDKMFGGGDNHKGNGRHLPFTINRRLLYALALPPVGLALLLSLSRGAILLGIPAGVATLGLLTGGHWRKLTLIALLLFAVALIPLFQTPRFAGLLDTASGTTHFRLALWRSAWQMFLEHPLWGVGPDNFLYAYRTRYVLPSAWEEFNLAHPHNWILDFASRLGILGLGAFLWIQFGFWRRVIARSTDPQTQNRALILGLTGSMAVFLAHGLVDASYFYIDLAYVFFLTLAGVQWNAVWAE